MLRGEADAVAGSAVRIWSAAGEVVGAGFVAGPDTVATCAHVVAEAVGADPYAAGPPGAPVVMDLPLLGRGGAPKRVLGIVSRWLPIGPDGTGDIALVRVGEPLPVGSRMPPLRRADELWDHRFRALGFPDGAWDGVWSSGVLRAGQGTGWVQLQSDAGGQPVVGGFSGSAVWDSDSGAVVGMTVAADRSGTTTAYLVPIDQVLGLDPELLPCPYQGLAPFTEEHAAFFFGRDEDIERLVDAVATVPVVALAGPSGAGKSSLLRAGLVPRLRRAGAQMVEVLPGASVTDFEPDGTDQVLVLDQFEELAARDPRAARAQLEEIVRLTGAGPVRAVLTVRGAALDDLLTPDLARVLDAGTLHVAPMDRANLRETIVRPAERAPGLDFEPGLVDRILDDAGAEPGQLPLVESLLADLWRRREGGRLTWRGYTEAGGVVGAVAQHAEQVVAGLAGAAPGPGFHDRLRQLFARLAAPDRTGRFLRVPLPLADLAPEVRSLVPRLAAGRLLVLGRDARGAEVVELAHQALIEHWPRLRDWLEQDREFLAWRARADQQRDGWEAAGRDDGGLLRGSALVAAGEWLPARASEVAESTREFVARSGARQRRDVRRWRIVTAIFATLALVAGALAVISVQRGDRLAAQLAGANAETVGREASARAGSDPLMSAQLALAAWRADPTSPAARTALVDSATALQDVDLVLPDLRGTAWFVGLQDDVTITQSLDETRTVVTGATGPDPQRWRMPRHDPVSAITYGGSWLAVSDPRDGIAIWDIATRTLRRTVAVQGAVLSMSDRRDGTLGVLLDRGEAGIVLSVVAVDTGDPAAADRPLPGAARDLQQVVASPDGKTLAEHYGAGPGTERWMVRTLASDPAADVETPLPAGTQSLGEGLGRLECVPPPPDRPTGTAAVRVVPVYGEVSARTVPLTAGSCDDVRVTADAGWLVDRPVPAVGATRQVLRLTDLRDGTQVQVVLPNPRSSAPSIRAKKALTTDGTIVAKRTDAGDVVVYAAVVDILDPKAAGATVVRARGAFVPPGVATRFVSTDGRYVVVPTTAAGLTVSDRATGNPVASLAIDVRPDNSTIVVDDDVWISLHEPQGWVLRRYDLPSLTLAATYALPGGGAAAVSDFTGRLGEGAVAADPVVALTGGVLAARDRATGAALGPEVALGATDAERSRVLRSPQVVMRPGHPGQVLVDIAGGGVQLWDAVAGRELGRLPVETTGLIAVSRDGRSIAVPTRDRTVEIYDLDSLALRRPPIPVSDLGVLVGFDPDGYLVSTGEPASATAGVVTFVDVEAGRVAGTVAPGTNVRAILSGPDRSGIVTGMAGGQAVSVVPLLARDWVARICSLVDRPYSDAELAVLPDGMDTSPPCER